MKTSQTGRLGEEETARRLLGQGYTILSRNYRSPYGEIDLIAAKDTILAFVEVKTRSPGALGSPGAAVDARKQRRILKTALCFLEEHPSPLQPRFDVAEVLLAQKGSSRIAAYNYLEGAFTADETIFDD